MRFGINWIWCPEIKWVLRFQRSQWASVEELHKRKKRQRILVIFPLVLNSFDIVNEVGAEEHHELSCFFGRRCF